MFEHLFCVEVCNQEADIVALEEEETNNERRPRLTFIERKSVIIFLLTGLNMCFGFSKEPSH